MLLQSCMCGHAYVEQLAQDVPATAEVAGIIVHVRFCIYLA
jgi:hypothetical protein